MPKAHVRNGELTIPPSEEIREQLDVHEGDELEAHVFPGSVVFRTSAPDTRERAWERIFSIIDQVHVHPGQPAMPIEDVEQTIVDEVKEVRRSRS